jgi:hypothetical protein
MYIQFVAPIGPGGQSAAALPSVSLDSMGVAVAPVVGAATLPTGVAVSSPVAVAANGTAVSSPAPVVLPWVDYGGGASGGPDAPDGQAASWQTPMSPASSRFRPWFAGDMGGVPPWSDAALVRSCACAQRGGILDWVKQHPWVTLGVAAAAVVILDGRK